MLRHYLTVALRGLVRYRLHSVVSIAVLALGLVCFIAAYLVVSDLRSYDRHFSNAERIHVIYQGMEGPTISWTSWPMSSYLLGEQIALDAPDLHAVARYRSVNGAFVTVDGESRTRRVACAETAFLEIFDFVTLAGEAEALFAQPKNAIITASAAESLFGTREVVGRVVTLTERVSADVTIAAVIEDLPRNSHFDFELLLSWEMGETLSPLMPRQRTWFNTSVFTYVLLPAGGSMRAADLDRRLAALVQRHAPDQGVSLEFRARPVSSLAAGMMQGIFQGLQGPRPRFDVFGALLLCAGAILLVACMNFVNLAIARAAARAREVGVRKVVGAVASQVIRQELLQTALLAAIAAVVAIATIQWLALAVDDPWRHALENPWREPRFWWFLPGVIGAVTIVAGLYPALVLARVQPIAALRAGTIRGGSRRLRTLLVGAQFAIASFLGIAVLVIFAQRDNMRDALLGRFSDQHVVVSAPPPGGTPQDPEIVAAELIKGPGIKGVTNGRDPWQFSGARPQLARTPDAPGVMVEWNTVGYDFFGVMEISLVAGRAFARERADATRAMAGDRPSRTGLPPAILDRAAARALGWARPGDAIGETFYVASDWSQTAAFEIIGIAETVPLAIRDRGSVGMGYAFDARGAAALATFVRVSQDRVAESLAHIDAVYKALEPNRPPRGRMFLDQAFEDAYRTFRQVSFVFTTLGVVAIAIAAFGQFGMASYLTARRTREIGLRKSQGASSTQIVRLLGWEFSRPVLVANVLVWPFALLAIDRYLDLFAVRVTVTPVPFVVALLGTLLVAWLAVGGQVVRAAWTSPAVALRDE